MRQKDLLEQIGGLVQENRALTQELEELRELNKTFVDTIATMVDVPYSNADEAYGRFEPEKVLHRRARNAFAVAAKNHYDSLMKLSKENNETKG